MDGNTEFKAGADDTDDCANCPTCRAYAIISRQIIRDGEVDLIDAAIELAEWMASPAPGIDPDEPGAVLNSRCVFSVANAMDWKLKASSSERFARAKSVGLRPEELEALLRQSPNAEA